MRSCTKKVKKKEIKKKKKQEIVDDAYFLVFVCFRLSCMFEMVCGVRRRMSCEKI